MGSYCSTEAIIIRAQRDRFVALRDTKEVCINILRPLSDLFFFPFLPHLYKHAGCPPSVPLLFLLGCMKGFFGSAALSRTTRKVRGETPKGEAD